MVQEGGKAAMGGCTGGVVMNPILCCLYWNKVLMLDELLIRGADDGDVSCAGMDLQWFFTVCTMIHMLTVWVIFLKYLPSFFGLELLVQWLLSLWPCVSSPVYHPDTSSPVSTLESCFALTSNRLHASLAIPSLKYLWFSFNQTATANTWLGPFFGSWAKHGAFDAGRIIFWIFSHLSSSVIFGHLSSTEFKNPSGIFIWMRGQTAPLMTMCSVALSVILANALMLAQTDDKCW